MIVSTIDGAPGDSDLYPRTNVVGRYATGRPGPTIHFNGHLDVVEVGQGWTVDPFAGLVRELCDSPFDADATLDGADALLVVTEWKEFRTPDFDRIKTALKQPVVFDGRNIWEPQLMKTLGIEYHGIGRAGQA